MDQKEQKREKKIFKILKRSSIFIGVGFGFLILIPFLPDIADNEKQLAIKNLFFLSAKSVVAYGVLMCLTVFFLRNKALLIDSLMNFFIVPTYVLWFAYEAYAILG